MSVGDISLIVTTPASTATDGVVLLEDADTATFESGASDPVDIGDLVALVPFTTTVQPSLPPFGVRIETARLGRYF